MAYDFEGYFPIVNNLNIPRLKEYISKHPHWYEGIEKDSENIKAYLELINNLGEDVLYLVDGVNMQHDRITLYYDKTNKSQSQFSVFIEIREGRYFWNTRKSINDRRYIRDYSGNVYNSRIKLISTLRRKLLSHAGVKL
jgi:hypothetical protein